MRRLRGRASVASVGVVVVGDAVALVLAGTALDSGLAGFAYSLGLLFVLAPTWDLHTRIDVRLAKDLPRLIVRLVLPLVVLSPLPFFRALVTPRFTLLPLLTGVVLLNRLLSYGFLRALRRSRCIVEPTLIVGTGKVAAQLAISLQEHPEYGLQPVGLLGSWATDVVGLPILGSLDDLERVVRELGITRIIVAFGLIEEAGIVSLIRRCQGLDVEVYVVPRLFELDSGIGGSPVEDVWGTAVRRLPRRALRSPTWRVKRLLDIALASLLLVLTAPVQAFVALSVRLTLGRPILFRQSRVGMSGRVFEIVKFRTLPANSDSDMKWTALDGPPCPRLGRLLRRTGLDELPQLFNVLRGDMSLVGPRPERPYFTDEFAATIPRYGDRLRVPAGITGWAQINGLVGDTSIQDRTRFDNNYIENWSPWLDMLILVRTIGETLKGGKMR